MIPLLPSGRLWSVASHWLPANLAMMPTRAELREWADVAALRPNFGLTASGVATIRLSGVLCRRESAWCRAMSGTSVDLVCESIAKAADDSRVKAIVLNVDGSPGGESRCVDDIALAVEACPKLCAAFLSGECHAEAFGIAVACDEVYIAPDARVGAMLAHECIDPLVLVADAEPLPVGFAHFMHETEKRFGREALQREQERVDDLIFRDDFHSVCDSRSARAKYIEGRRSRAMSCTASLTEHWNGPPLDAAALLSLGLVDEIVEADEVAFAAAWSAT